MKKLLTLLLTLVIAIALININIDCAKADQENKEYVYTHDGNKWSEAPQSSYKAGDTIQILNEGVLSIPVYWNGSKYSLSPWSREEAYEVQYDGATLQLNDDSVIFFEGNPFPIPSPKPEPKDERCEVVVGPTWHWNNEKGVCEDYGVVDTSTR